MEWIAVLEKLKNAIVPLIAGLLCGVSLTWTTTTKLHEEHLKILETGRAELERQIAIRDKVIEQKDTELKALAANLSVQPVAVSSSPKTSAELQKFIEELDAEIERKKQELARHSRLMVVEFGENVQRETPKSDSLIRIEQELHDLSEQRKAARQRLIDGLSK